MYATGNLSLKRVAKQLYDEGFIYKESKPIINTSKLETILKSHFYYGIIEYKGEFYEGKHEPLITKELFEQVQIAFKKIINLNIKIQKIFTCWYDYMC